MWLLMMPKGIYRTLLEIYLFAVVFIDLFYFLITGTSFGQFEAISLLDNVSFAGPAAKSFYPQLIQAFILTSFIFLVGYFLLKDLRGFVQKKNQFYVAAFTIVIVCVYKTDTELAESFSAPLRIPMSLVLGCHRPACEERKEVTIKIKGNQVKHLALIVDESINSSALGINGCAFNTTPFLKSVSDTIINFHSICSFTNYSAGTNFSLFSGARMKDLPDGSMKLRYAPSIFQYAKKAGYKTVLIDAQTSKGKWQNHLCKQDFNYIDSFIQPAGVNNHIPISLGDQIIADLLIKFCNDETPVFIYVIKAGAHWPYKESHPKLYTLEGLDEKVMPNKDVYHYLLAVNWSVDQFMERLWNGLLKNNNTTLFYTSDHGENYSGVNSQLKHGSLMGARHTEGEVPLLLIDKSNFFKDNQTSIKTNKPYHQEQIFPTILLSMGFDLDFVKSKYGPSLFDEPSEAPFFITGDVFARGRNSKIFFPLSPVQ